MVVTGVTLVRTASRARLFAVRSLPAIALGVFLVIGIVLAFLRDNGWYFCLFAAIGVLAGTAEWLNLRRPGSRQRTRLAVLAAISALLFGYLSLVVSAGFQFPQLVFEAAAGLVSCAWIQFVVARLALPLLFGSCFCSRACWDGFAFELLERRHPEEQAVPRSEALAWGYVAILVGIAAAVSRWDNPALDEVATRWWVVSENVLIVGVGLLLASRWGSRAYCRRLCPFLTVSGLVSKLSVFKITPVRPEFCVECGRCDRSCPMLIEVMAYVRRRKRISDRCCTLCEECVDACPNHCLALSYRSAKPTLTSVKAPAPHPSLLRDIVQPRLRRLLWSRGLDRGSPDRDGPCGPRFDS